MLNVPVGTGLTEIFEGKEQRYGKDQSFNSP